MFGAHRSRVGTAWAQGSPSLLLGDNQWIISDSLARMVNCMSDLGVLRSQTFDSLEQLQTGHRLERRIQVHRDEHVVSEVRNFAKAKVGELIGAIDDLNEAPAQILTCTRPRNTRCRSDRRETIRRASRFQPSPAAPGCTVDLTNQLGWDGQTNLFRLHPHRSKSKGTVPDALAARHKLAFDEVSGAQCGVTSRMHARFLGRPQLLRWHDRVRCCLRSGHPKE